MFTATKEQIENWKGKHGDIFRINVDEKSCYLKKPSRKILGYASIAAKTNPLKFNEVLLKECWLDGDAEIKTDDDLFLSVSSKLSEIVEVREAELEKL
jgi:hypothetical protein